ncbi:MAG: hypothetical protein U0K91_11775, partial [Acutalibacteraceae bacterium]|nr:hypothetical protein [Acutalibacteraceae bacterium]
LCIQPSNNGRQGDKMENNNYNKRRRSYTEFRKTYSDNKKYFISTDKRARWQPLISFIVIALIFVFIAFASFIITDALLEISKAPYEEEEITTEATTNPAESYFENQVTIPADEVDEMQNNDMKE